MAIRPLRYRSYKEILGADSDLTRMLAACLREGKTIQRGEVEHITADSEVRRLGVTISPIYRAVRNPVPTGAGSTAAGRKMKVSGALCLMSDLTEITALQKQMRWKENLAALGEMSAGIAHEFKNSLATISGYAQMIRGESKPGETRDSAERILDQTRALTHVVTEFLRFAKPLEICYETVPVQSLVGRVAEELRESIPQCAIRCEGTFMELPGDEALIRQALLNLVRNATEAAHASERSPCVTISGTLEEIAGRKWQRICVADNGPGIPEHDLSENLPAVLYDQGRRHGPWVGCSAEDRAPAWRQHRGSQPRRRRGRVLLWLPLRQEPSPTLFPSEAAPSKLG